MCHKCFTNGVNDSYKPTSRTKSSSGIDHEVQTWDMNKLYYHCVMGLLTGKQELPLLPYDDSSDSETISGLVVQLSLLYLLPLQEFVEIAEVGLVPDMQRKVRRIWLLDFAFR